MSYHQKKEVEKFLAAESPKSFTPKKLNQLFEIENAGRICRELLKAGTVQLKKGCYRVPLKAAV